MVREAYFIGTHTGLLPLQCQDSEVLAFSEFQPNFLPVPSMPWKHLGTRSICKRSICKIYGNKVYLQKPKGEQCGK